MKEVAQQLENLRSERDEEKKTFQKHFDRLQDLDSQITEVRHLFKSLQQKSGIIIPSAELAIDTERRGNFLDAAENRAQEAKFIDKGEKRLKDINEKIDEKVKTDARASFLDQSEHIMRVDKFVGSQMH